MRRRNGRGLARFAFRFSERKPRDIALSQWIAEDIDRGEVNVSEVVKDLLYEWYLRRREVGDLLPRQVAGQVVGSGPNGGERLEDPNDPLVRRMAGISFENL